MKVWPREITERGFQRQVIELARLRKWLCYHTWMSAHSAAGFPDLVLARPPRVLFVELKTERGKVSDAQQAWLAALWQCEGIETFLWRPSDWAAIDAALA